MNRIPILRSSPKLMPLRLINAVVVLARVAERYGITVEQLLDGSGIHPDDLYDPKKMITIKQEMTVTRTMGRLLAHVPWIGLEVGKDYHFSANGKLGLAMMCSETMLDALKLAMTYTHLTNSYHRYTLYLKNGVGYGEFKELIDLGGIRAAVCEAEVASLFAMSQLGYEGAVPFSELRFAYPRPSYANQYTELFNCPVAFDAKVHTIVFDPVYLSRPLKMANPLVKSAMEKECRDILPLLDQQATLSARIHQELSAMNDEFPTLDQLARRISLSPRTLRRRLEEERTSYKTIQSDIRKCRAMELLKTTTLTMENVAARLGFREVSSFYRAFKSWTGVTPSRYRDTV